MNSPTRTQHKIFSARWTSPESGIVSLTRDWFRQSLPPLFWGDSCQPLEGLRKAPLLMFGELSGYYSQGAMLTFCLRASRYPNYELDHSGVFVAGEFNGWQPGFDRSAWRLEPAIIGGQEYYLLNAPKNLCCGRGKSPFKFISGNGQWLEVPGGAPNIVQDEQGNHNLYIHPFRTGHHQFLFTPPTSIGRTGGHGRVLWVEDDLREEALMMPGEYLLEIDSGYDQGVTIAGGQSFFRIFAPRANAVTLRLSRRPDMGESVLYAATRIDMGTWEAVVPEDCQGAYYFYHIDGDPDPFSAFDPRVPILDPWALACVGAAGPAIALDRSRVARPSTRFDPPHWHDLVIAEAHVRDLCAQAPLELSAVERRGFSGLAKWVRHPDFYLAKLGVNAVELQPIQQNDEPSAEGYHWGYMTTNFFAPNCHYAQNPLGGAQLDEFRDLVAAFHERGMAVILDVVYNHVGEPNFLQHIDKRYYFDLKDDGSFTNWSGCGNTLNCVPPMSYKLVSSSLAWLVEAFDVDGFRFDLAELVGLGPLKRIEQDLKRIKPSVILIAEPWSYRGHIAFALRDTGFASWNDGYREYLRRYLTGQDGCEGLKYFLNGSMGFLSAWPAQSVNYVESHDDMCWIDRITENMGCNGDSPSPADRRRTHMMCAILMMSLGIPMLHAGQDFLRTKLGHTNTYKMGDVNAMDYRRLRYFSGTHDYFRRWIAFRQSDWGRVLRLGDRPGTGYLRHVQPVDGGLALGSLFNADGALGPVRLFFAVNPSSRSCVMPADLIVDGNFTQIADTELVVLGGLPGAARLPVSSDGIELPPLSVALWMEQ